MARVKIGNVRTPIDYLKQFFAPTGYGLGTQNGHDCTDCNAAILNGVYYLFGESAQNHPGHSMQYGCLVVYRRGSYITQVIHYDYFEAKRYSKDGGNTWGEWEWVNPPMAIGVEYRTTERWNGKPVYTALVDCGTCEGTHHDVSTNIHAIHMVRHCGHVGGYCLPMINGTLDNMYSAWANVIDSNGYIRVTIYNGSGLVGNAAEVQVWYTKE